VRSGVEYGSSEKEGHAMGTSMKEVKDFLALRRIALVGVSRNTKDFSRVVFAEMAKRGYDMVPVNPAISQVRGKRCYARLQEITPRVDGALIMTASEKTEEIVRNCEEAGIRHIWMHRGGGQGSVNVNAVQFCHEKGIHLVEGQCPLMFLKSTPLFHRIHGFVLKITGRYPRTKAA
jgi:uncharacterized protein